MKTDSYKAFDKKWFLKHQSKLLRLLRYKLFRKILRIDTDLPIIAILPNAYTVYLGKTKKRLKLQTDFRTHWKYSKRLYHAFKPLWWVMHVWDLFADSLVPQLSFGFSTLTSYPDADPETTTVDGHVEDQTSNQTWASKHDNTTGTNADDSTALSIGPKVSCGTTTNRYEQIYRAFALFDTSSLTSSATISDAVLSWWGRSGSNNLSGTEPQFNIYAATPASNTALVNEDYDQVGTTAYATAIAFSSLSLSNSAYNDFTFNSTGRAAISKTGITKTSWRESVYDAANVAPTWGSETQVAIGTYYSEQTGNSNDPKLVVTYSVELLPSVNDTATLTENLNITEVDNVNMTQVYNRGVKIIG